MNAGIAPQTLLSQVENTAPWALADTSLAAASVLRDAPAIEARWRADPHDLGYVRLLLASHYLTVATFVPTDVDARIRHHLWTERDGLALDRALDVVDEAASWNPRAVSARVVDDPNEAPGAPTGHGARGISGHDGEWLSVWAGALGRALAVGATNAAERARERIETSLTRQARIYAAHEKSDPTGLVVLRAATVLAHNSGDLSRVVEAWPRSANVGTAVEEARAHFGKLGHERADRYGGAFVRAGAVNKAMMATENHRFLPMRKPRALRGARALLLPFGPFFDDWGATVGKHPSLEPRDHAEIVDALLEIHLRDPEQRGCLRALAALHENLRGGLDRVSPDLPARMRKLVAAGPVREAIRVSRAAFEARTTSRWKALPAA